MKPENRVTLATSGSVDKFGTVTLVDPDRLAELSAYRWYVKRTPRGNYVFRVERINGRCKSTFLHQHILGKIPNGCEVDHRNLNRMDNRRSNLRAASRSQNMRNIGKCRGQFSSQFKGVSLDRRSNKWAASARILGKTISLGYFDATPYGEIAAARAYDDFARMHFGEFARLNFPNDSTAPRIKDA